VSFLSDARIVSRALDRFLRESVQRGGRVVTQQPIEDLVAGLDLEGHALRLRGSDAAQLAARIRASSGPVRPPRDRSAR